MYAIWVPFQGDDNCDEIAAGWFHDCGQPLTFDTPVEAKEYGDCWLLNLHFEIRLYDEEEPSLSDA